MDGCASSALLTIALVNGFLYEKQVPIIRENAIDLAGPEGELAAKARAQLNAIR